MSGFNHAIVCVDLKPARLRADGSDRREHAWNCCPPMNATRVTWSAGRKARTSASARSVPPEENLLRVETTGVLSANGFA